MKTVNDVTRIVNKISDILNTKQELVMHFTMGTTKFGFIPKLDSMSFGEYIDLDTNIGDWQKIEKAMAVLYRPVIKEYGNLYDIEDYRGDNYHDIMNNMPLDAVFGSLVFLSFRDRIIQNYDELFNGGTPSDGFDIGANFNKKWGWYTLSLPPH